MSATPESAVQPRVTTNWLAAMGEPVRRSGRGPHFEHTQTRDIMSCDALTKTLTLDGDDEVPSITSSAYPLSVGATFACALVE